MYGSLEGDFGPLKRPHPRSKTMAIMPTIRRQACFGMESKSKRSFSVAYDIPVCSATSSPFSKSSSQGWTGKWGTERRSWWRGPLFQEGRRFGWSKGYGGERSRRRRRRRRPQAGAMAFPAPLCGAARTVVAGVCLRQVDSALLYPGSSQVEVCMAELLSIQCERVVWLNTDWTQCFQLEVEGGSEQAGHAAPGR